MRGALVWASDSDADMLEKYDIHGIERQESPKWPAPQIPDLPGALQETPKTRPRALPRPTISTQFPCEVYLCVKSSWNRRRHCELTVTDLHNDPSRRPKTSDFVRDILQKHKIPETVTKIAMRALQTDVKTALQDPEEARRNPRNSSGIALGTIRGTQLPSDMFTCLMSAWKQKKPCGKALTERPAEGQNQ